jgi:hypothetical protein
MGRGECSGPDSGSAGTQEHPAVEHEHVCCRLRVAFLVAFFRGTGMKSTGRAYRTETEIVTSTLPRIAFEYGQMA